MSRVVNMSAIFAVTLAVAAPAQAQFNGSHTLGDFGVQSGSQPAPGFYLSGFYYRYKTDTIRDRDGNRITLDPGAPGSLSLQAVAPIAWYVSKTKVLGGNYGIMAVLPFANGVIDAPVLGLTSDTGNHLSDLYIRPLDLGWRRAQADVVAGFGFYAPTGEFELGGSENTGRGMWTSEPFVGTTVFLDSKRSVSLATTASWEIHGKKKDTDIKVGQILSLEGGGGKSFLGGGLIVGAAYYAQWKLTRDNIGPDILLPGGGTVDLNLELQNKHRVFGFGPDVTVPIASRTKLFSLVNIRYFWESGARTKTEGDSLVITATFPVPSVKIQ